MIATAHRIVIRERGAAIPVSGEIHPKDDFLNEDSVDNFSLDNRLIVYSQNAIPFNTKSLSGIIFVSSLQQPGT